MSLLWVDFLADARPGNVGGVFEYFDTPPAVGATISVTYQPDCLAKNSNKIMKNMSYKLQMPL